MQTQNISHGTPKRYHYFFTFQSYNEKAVTF